MSCKLLKLRAYSMSLPMSLCVHISTQTTKCSLLPYTKNVNQHSNFVAIYHNHMKTKTISLLLFFVRCVCLRWHSHHITSPCSVCGAVCAICLPFSWLHERNRRVCVCVWSRVYGCVRELAAEFFILAFWSDACVVVDGNMPHFVCLFIFALHCTAYNRLFGQSVNQLAHNTEYIQSDFFPFGQSFLLRSIFKNE